jgi:hypothetical protein
LPSEHSGALPDFLSSDDQTAEEESEVDPHELAAE